MIDFLYDFFNDIDYAHNALFHLISKWLLAEYFGVSLEK